MGANAIIVGSLMAILIIFSAGKNQGMAQTSCRDLEFTATSAMLGLCDVNIDEGLTEPCCSVARTTDFSCFCENDPWAISVRPRGMDVVRRCSITLPDQGTECLQGQNQGKAQPSCGNLEFSAISAMLVLCDVSINQELPESCCSVARATDFSCFCDNHPWAVSVRPRGMDVVRRCSITLPDQGTECLQENGN